MENLVPLGTGNSRFMKSNIPASTTLAQLIQMLNNGTFPYDIGTINPAGISQQGTPLNKATLLKDATAALYGLGTDAVPDDVFEVLSNAALYEDGKFVFPRGEDIPYVSIETGSYVGTGTAGQNNPTIITFDKGTPEIIFIAATTLVTYSGSKQTIDVSSPFIKDINVGFVLRQSSSADVYCNPLTLQWDSNTLRFYHKSQAYVQLNQSGITYKYVALFYPGGDEE